MLTCIFRQNLPDLEHVRSFCHICSTLYVSMWFLVYRFKVTRIFRLRNVWSLCHSSLWCCPAAVQSCIVPAAPQVCSIAAAKAGAASSVFSRQLNQNCCLAASAGTGRYRQYCAVLACTVLSWYGFKWICMDREMEPVCRMKCWIC